MDLNQDVLVTMREAASVLPVSLSYLYALAKDGRIPVVMFGNKMLLQRSVVDKLETGGTGPYAGIKEPTPALKGAT
jgi:excisionase family DNA binding protein